MPFFWKREFSSLQSGRLDAIIEPMQNGNIFKSHNAWFVRYYSTEIKDGAPVRRRISKWLAPVSDEYRNKGDLKDLAIEATGNVNARVPEAGLTISEFTKGYFLPFIKAKRKPSTHKFYREVFQNHLEGRIGEIKLRDFTTGDAQRVLDGIQLSHQSLLRIKTGMSAIFTFARQRNFVRSANPVQGVRAEGHRTDPEQYAYTLDEVLYMLQKLKGVARTAAGVAAFSGLREAELRGLQWEDYTGDLLHVRRNVWRTHVGETKTPESKNAVPVIEPLRKLLDQHRRNPLAKGSAWIFAGPKKGFALHFDNLCRRDIRPVLKDKWHGWHAFRRGLATVLFGLGVPAETAKTILRHARVETTRAHYIVLESKKAGAAAMRKLEKAIGKRAANGQQRKRRKSRQPA